MRIVVMGPSGSGKSLVGAAVAAALRAEDAGADLITLHLREDRRHITDRDVRILRQTLHTRMNLEMAVTEEMLTIACETKPHFCCLVPEKRQEAAMLLNADARLGDDDLYVR